VAGLATVVAATAGASTAQAEGRAVSLDVAKTLAVVALLSLGGAGKRAAVGLMAGLLACFYISQPLSCHSTAEELSHTVVAKALSRRADLGVVANIATLVARATRERRHGSNLRCLENQLSVNHCT
jgi:hypothetical protein